MFLQGSHPLGQVKSTKVVLDPNIVGTAPNIIAAVQGAMAAAGSAPSKYWTFGSASCAEAASYDSISPPWDVEFSLLVPVKPTAGDIRAWGIKSPKLANRGRIEFDVTDDVFTAKVYNETGTALTVTGGTITWDDTNWTNKTVRYRIKHSGDLIEFFINETRYATCSAADGLALPLIPNHIHILNSNADVAQLGAILIRSAYNL